MQTLGVSAFYHDSAAALIKDGHILAAAQEERFTRKKHDASFPNHSVKYCLKNNIKLDRKILSDLVINDTSTFEKIVKKAVN